MQKKRPIAYSLALVFSALLLLGLMQPGNAQFHASGAMNAGHEKLACNDCHREDNNSLRQQLQANVGYLLGQRAQSVKVGYRRVGNRDCIACHDRRDDNHPVYRFEEPKYAEIRKIIAVQNCATCHPEHQNRPVSVALEFCRHCHEKIDFKNDPLDKPHGELVETGQWRTCLGCHDFHGNHKMKLNTAMRDVIAVPGIEKYFAGAPSPYSKIKKFPARSHRP